MKIRAAIVAALSVLILAPAAYAATYGNALTDPRAHAGEIPGAVDTDYYVGRNAGWRASTLWVGDSVTTGAYRAVLAPQRLTANQEVSSIPGRDVSTLPYYLRDRLQDRLTLKRVVIALGTNATPGWTYADYRAAVNLLPATTVVVFVTTYRDPKIWSKAAGIDDQRRQAGIQDYYSRWMKRIAQLRPHTCVADWRDFATRYPQVVHDGVHPTDAGYAAWAKIATYALAHCL